MPRGVPKTKPEIGASVPPSFPPSTPPLVLTATHTDGSLPTRDELFSLAATINEPSALRKSVVVVPRPSEIRTDVRTASGSTLSVRENTRYGKVSISDEDASVEFSTEDVPKVLEALKAFLLP